MRSRLVAALLAAALLGTCEGPAAVVVAVLLAVGTEPEAAGVLLAAVFSAVAATGLGKKVALWPL